MSSELDQFESDELKIGFSSLERGRLYPVLSVEKTEAVIFGKKVKGLKAKIDDGDIIMFTYLPKKFVDISDDLVNQINTAGDTAAKYSVCYYGTIQSSVTTQAFIGRIHRPNENRNEKLYEDIAKMMKKYGLKRSANEEAHDSGPSKMRKDSNE